MKLKLIKIWNITKFVGLVIVIFGSIGLVEKQYGERICTSINVEIDNQFENYFINESDIVDLITDGGDNRIVGASFDDLNLKTIEDELLATKFIQNAEVYKDLEGRLTISIPLRISGSIIDSRVVSCPPCADEDAVKTAAGFPTMVPRNHNAPSPSTKYFIGAAILPNRVGLPSANPAHSSRSLCST